MSWSLAGAIVLFLGALSYIVYIFVDEWLISRACHKESERQEFFNQLRQVDRDAIDYSFDRAKAEMKRYE